ncbi:MAG: chromosomal replication initiator protein DnaA [Acidobacteria bacterium]|nr:MAG: chromosomal replication initiator protein DnaA [Acidobacteriota bacterium]
MNLWEEVLHKVESKVNQHSFNTWFRPTRLLFETGNTVGVLVPNNHFRDWLNKHYSGIIHESLDELHRPDLEVVFETNKPDEPASSSENATSTGASFAGNASRAPITHTPPTPPLNLKYQFESFVVGTSNQFAHAAARAVAEAPSRAYNPLFIYGGVGLGKTHLLHAIGHQILEQQPSTKLVYISAEMFMNELINAIRYDRILDFRDKHRSFDVLLVDDIQFIAGKERTQEEFFHTFNALYDAQKQIVITSDSPPREIPTLEERLRSRFEWGLTADIQAPDLETKIAILRKKADAEAVELPDDVTIFIASRIKSNIRELEGSLIRLIAYSSLTGRSIDLALTQDVLKDLLPNEDRLINLDAIQKYVADYYRLKVADLKARNNAKSVTLPRQIAMYLGKSLTKASLPDIGKAFGGKHHSTVIHSVRKIANLRKSDPEFDKVIQGFLDSFR